MTTAAFDQLADRGLAIYNDKLRSRLEPEQNGRVVAIHVDSEDYALGRNSHKAVRAIRGSHPDGRLAVLIIGPEPDYSLAVRLMAGQMVAERDSPVGL